MSEDKKQVQEVEEVQAQEQETRLTYIYAQILVSTRRCVAVTTTETEKQNSSMFEYVRLDNYDQSYRGKYYINGAWYEDSAGTIPWSPAE